MRWLILRCLSHGNPECHKLHFCPVQRKNKNLVITGLVPVTQGIWGQVRFLSRPHSIVSGSFEVTSYTTRLILFTSASLRCQTPVGLAFDLEKLPRAGEPANGPRNRPLFSRCLLSQTFQM